MEYKKCKICEENLSVEGNFYVCNTINGKKYYRGECKKCKNDIEKARQHDLYKFVRDYKKNHSCNRCGFEDYRALQFHHHSDDKYMAVSEMCSNGYSKESLLREIKKCEILCANCHTIEHSNYKPL